MVSIIDSVTETNGSAGRDLERPERGNCSALYSGTLSSLPPASPACLMLPKLPSLRKLAESYK